MHLFWPDQGWRHSSDMLTHELEQLSENFTTRAVVQEPGRSARWLVEQAYEWMFVRTGLADWMRESSDRASVPSGGGERDFRYYISQVYV